MFWDIEIRCRRNTNTFSCAGLKQCKCPPTLTRTHPRAWAQLLYCSEFPFSNRGKNHRTMSRLILLPVGVALPHQHINFIYWHSFLGKIAWPGRWGEFKKKKKPRRAFPKFKKSHQVSNGRVRHVTSLIVTWQGGHWALVNVNEFTAERATLHTHAHMLV